VGVGEVGSSEKWSLDQKKISPLTKRKKKKEAKLRKRTKYEDHDNTSNNGMSKWLWQCGQ